jgi:phospholipase C
MQRRRSTLVIGMTAVVGVAGLSASATGLAAGKPQNPAAAVSTTTPIKHLVVIFQENVSFDHYFGTYPHALNPVGQPAFTARKGTPTVDGLSGALLTANPNLGNPQRLDRSQALTCDMGHGYTDEQSAMNQGAADRYVQFTGRPNNTGKTLGECLGTAPTPGNYAVMDYYDGNTVTGLWNYAQRYAMSDSSFATGFGPSTPGAMNVTSGQTFGVNCARPAASVFHAPADCPAMGVTPATPGSVAPVVAGAGTTFGDSDPYFDVCSNNAIVEQHGGRTVGDQLSARGLSWGFFTGGFASPGYVPGNPATDNLSPAALCHGTHTNTGGATVTDYIPHHEPFQYHPSTANPQHLPPTSVAAVGHQDQANHQYDLADFFAAANAGNLPSVSYLKAPAYQDGHPGYSDPLDEQTFLVDTINHLQQLPTWKSTAVVVAYDDSDGWYDHVVPPVLFQSQTSLDTLTNPGMCGGTADGRIPTGFGGQVEQARCGYGQRLPLMVISPFSRQNFVDHAATDQSSVVRFIQDNWGLARIGDGSADAFAGSLTQMMDFHRANRSALILDPATGTPVSHPTKGH